MSLSRKLLESLGLEADKVSTIIEAHAETVGALKEQIETYKAEADKASTTEAELSSLQTELDALKKGNWEQKYKILSSEFDEFKNAQDKKMELDTKTSAFKELLKEAGVSEKRLDSIIKLSDLDSIEVEDGKIKNADTLTESIKTEWADFITTTQTQGANTVTPPATNSVVKFSHEDIAKMTPDEINKNWDSIKLSMKGN